MEKKWDYKVGDIVKLKKPPSLRESGMGNSPGRR